MTDWLLAHQSTLQSFPLLGSIAVIAVWETYWPRRPFAVPLGARWVQQLALTALGSVFVRLCLPFAALAMAVLAEQRGWGLLNRVPLPFWLSCMLGILFFDLGAYAEHRAFHAVPFLWRFHQIHHSDLDVDCGTAIRHHPVEMLVTNAIDLALIAAFGISPLAVILATTLAGIASVFNHGNVSLGAGADASLRWLVVTPDMHRIHHSVAVDESNRNYSNLFSWWDRLFGSYQWNPTRGHERMELGLASARDPDDLTLWKLLALPSRRLPAPGYAGAGMGRPNPSP
jgi:sterol desaturase/sphingolipid hydroxylase (fatty acid hydroxylase superfamily)